MMMTKSNKMFKQVCITCLLAIVTLISSCAGLTLNQNVDKFSDEYIPRHRHSFSSENIPYIGKISLLNPELAGFKIGHQQVESIGTKILLSTSHSKFTSVEKRPPWYRFWSKTEQDFYRTSEEFKFLLSEYQYDLRTLRDVLSNLKYNSNGRILITVPGYLHSEKRDKYLWSSYSAELWHQLDPNATVLQVFWPNGARSVNYKRVVANTKIVARQVLIFLHYLAQLTNSNLKDEKFASRIQIVGHSLGAHIAGFIGDEMGGKIQRITGLDPAGPEFDDRQCFAYKHPPTELSLSSDDAQFVDVIGTNVGFLGTSKLVKNWIVDLIPSRACRAEHKNDACFGNIKLLGHVNYLANDGTSQPGCGKRVPTCDHCRATQIYLGLLTRATRKQGKLLAYNAESFEHLINGSFHFGNNEGISKVIAPIDVETLSANSLKNELINTYKIQINKCLISERAFYFPTTDIEPFVDDSYMLKINYDFIEWNQCELGITLKNDEAESTKLLLNSELHESISALIAVFALKSKSEPQDYFQSIVPNEIILKSKYKGTSLASLFQGDDCSMNIKSLELIRLSPHQSDKHQSIATYSAYGQYLKRNHSVKLLMI